MIGFGIFAALLITATVSTGTVFYDDFQAYDVENPSDFLTNGVPTGNWVPSSTASDATRIFNTSNYGGTRLWISNINGTSITSAGIAVESNTQYRLSVCLVLETLNAGATGTASYDVLLGPSAATAVSLVNGPVEVSVRGDNAGGAQNGTYNDQITTALFNVGDLEADEKLFLVFTRVSAGSWFGVDNVVVNKTKPSGRLQYSYGMSVLPGSQNLDGINGNDFWSPGQIPINDSGFAFQTNLNQNLYYRTDFSNPDSIWRTQFLGSRDYTIEFRASIGTNGTEGTSGTLGHAAGRNVTGVSDLFQLFIRRTGYGTAGVGIGEDNTGWHTYRIACSGAGTQVWRDGVPINGRLIPLSGSGNNYTYLGDWNAALGGEYYIDYYRLDPTGAYAPAAPVESGTVMQWGLDYTSGLIADQNGGIIEDDSGNNNDGQKYYNNPKYAADIPSAAKLRDCTGVGSIDLATTDHTSVKTVNNNIVTLDEVLAAGGVTMEIWAKQSAEAGSSPTALRGSGVIMTMQDAFSLASPYGKYRVVVNSFDNDGPQYAVSESAKIAAGWTHLAAVVRDLDLASDAGTNYTCTVELWVNGEMKESRELNYAPQIDLTRATAVGAALTSGSAMYRWDGYAYEPRITLGALDPNQFTFVKRYGTVILVQ